ncbi:hypothetical protein MRX96_055322 [Rhipicephalus microplus]
MLLSSSSPEFPLSPVATGESAERARRSAYPSTTVPTVPNRAPAQRRMSTAPAKPATRAAPAGRREPQHPGTNTVADAANARS